MHAAEEVIDTEISHGKTHQGKHGVDAVVADGA